jgi:uncharacterized protein YpmB
MPNAATAEVYFIAIMMVLILIVSFTATFIFFRQYKREMKSREEAKMKKQTEKSQAETSKSE